MRSDQPAIAATLLIGVVMLAACAGGGGNGMIPGLSTSVTASPAANGGGMGSGSSGSSPGAAGPPVPQIATPGGPVFHDTYSQGPNYPSEGVSFPVLVSVLQQTPNGPSAISGGQNASATLTKSNQWWTLAQIPGTHVELSVPAAGVNVSLDTPDLLGGLEDYYTFGLSYVVLGTWSSSYSPCAPCLNGKAMAFAFGYETPATSMPTTGQASFNGQVRGTVFAPNGDAIPEGGLIGDATFSADFASGRVTGAFTNMRSLTPWNDVSVNASIASGTNKFSGATAVTSAPQGMFSLKSSATGSINGAFYGPTAQNLGAVWTLSDGTKSALGGVVAGH